MHKRIWLKLLLIPLILLAAMAFEVEAAKSVYVKGYYRKNGTYVRPHYRTAPDSNLYNNYSFPGNYNPNTGKTTTGDAQKYLDRYYKRSTTYKAPTYKIPTYKSPTITPPTIKRPSTLYKPRTIYNRSTYKPSTTYNRSTTSNLGKLYEQARQVLNGAVLIADDGKATYLGKIGGHYESKSIFYKYGQHGGDYASKSIFNDYGQYGNNYSQYSPFSKYAFSPPYIVKNGVILGRLSVNETLKIRGNIVVSPYTLMVIYGKEKR